jgi:adenine-specific DNA-methyltransferase
MGRNMAKRDKPFRFILNRSKATAANVYLLLYPKPALAKALAENPGLSRQIWEFLNSIDAATLLGEGRVYGGGLYKMDRRNSPTCWRRQSPAAASGRISPISSR